MTGEYAIYMGSETIGQACVERQGLYYRIVCTCSFPESDIHKIELICGDRQLDLGVCIPIGRGFGLQTKIPVKRVGEGTPIFRVAEKERKPEGFFVPIDTSIPFLHLSRLRNAYWENRDGIAGIVLTDPVPDPQGSDPSQEHPHRSEP